MTKDEAIQAMKEGKKVTHRYFSSNEFITIDGVRYVDENGYKLLPYEFRIYRTETAWDNDWSIYQ